MSSFLVQPGARLKGEATLLGDKSIAHRCVIVSAISSSQTTIKNFPFNQDCLATLEAFEKLGVSIKKDLKAQSIKVSGRGLCGLNEAKSPIFVGDSGTTLRLLLGVLAGQNFKTKLVAAKSLSRRPMLRVTSPLRMMGARIKAKTRIKNSKVEEYPPIEIKGGKLNAITYKMPVASAQVKSAIMLAGLYVKEKTTIIELVKSRDHTERILKAFGVKIKSKGKRIEVGGGRKLFSPGMLTIPADISSASFFIVAATLLAGSKILLKNVSLNPYRTGAIRALRRMGAKIRIARRRAGFEPCADLLIESSPLRGVRVLKKEIPSLIDELPVLMVAASLAKGKSVFEGAGELRVKETDRIRSMSDNLRKMGAKIRIFQKKEAENIVIEGVKHLIGSKVRSFGDHRTAMSMIVAGMAARGNTRIDDVDCIKKSFPDFPQQIQLLTA